MPGSALTAPRNDADLRVLQAGRAWSLEGHGGPLEEPQGTTETDPTGPGAYSIPVPGPGLHATGDLAQLQDRCTFSIMGKVRGHHPCFQPNTVIQVVCEDSFDALLLMDCMVWVC